MAKRPFGKDREKYWCQALNFCAPVSSPPRAPTLLVPREGGPPWAEGCASKAETQTLARPCFTRGAFIFQLKCQNLGGASMLWLSCLGTWDLVQEP